MGTKGAWSHERRLKQAEIIRQTRPWERSTGPRTKQGKAASSRNAYAGDEIHRALQILANSRIATLELFDRKRMPKYPKA